MGIESAEKARDIARLVDAATRLRAVRDAQRHFLAMWKLEQELVTARHDSLVKDRLHRNLRTNDR